MKSRPFWHSLRPTICIGVAATPTFSRRQPSCVPLFRSTLRQGISIGWGRSSTTFACGCILKSPTIRAPISLKPSIESTSVSCPSNSVMPSVCSKCRALCLPWYRWVRRGRLVAPRQERGSSTRRPQRMITVMPSCFSTFCPDDAFVYETLHRIGLLCRKPFAQSPPKQRDDYTSPCSFLSGTNDSNVPSE